MATLREQLIQLNADLAPARAARVTICRWLLRHPLLCGAYVVAVVVAMVVTW